MHSDEAIWSTLDPAGRTVVLLERIWHGKVVLVHPELLPFADAVMGVVAQPDHIEVDRRYPRRMHYCGRDVGPSKWLIVVVSYEQQPARIVTAFGRGRKPLAWNS